MSADDLARLARRLPEHQPDDAGLARMRASLLQSLDRGPATRRWRRVAAPLAVALAAVAALLLWPRRDPLADAAVVLAERRATVQASTAAHFEHSRALVPSTSGGRPIVDEVVRLRRGRLAVAVDRLARGERFRVIAGDGEVEVRGTAFDVSVDGDRLVAVQVSHGVVAVRPAGGGEVEVRAGQAWSRTGGLVAAVDPAPWSTAGSSEPGAGALPAPAEHSGATVAAPTSSASEAPPGPEAARVPEAPRDPEAPRAQAASSASDAAAPTDARALAMAGAMEALRSRAAESTPATVPGPATSPDRAPDRAPAPATDPEPDRAAAPAPATDPEPPSATAPATDPVPDRAAAPAPATDPEPPSATAPALRPPTAGEQAFADGFRALRSGRHAEAAAVLARAIRPGEPLAADARYWRAIALARAGQKDAARRALADFVARHPRSERAGAASVTLGWLLLDSGDRRGAAARFRAALSDRDPTVIDGARRGLTASGTSNPR